MAKIPMFPTVGKTIKQSFLELYNSLGFTLLISIVWFIGYLPIFFAVWMAVAYLLKTLMETKTIGDAGTFLVLNMVFMAVWNGLLAGPVSTAIYATLQERKENYVNVKSFIQNFKKFYWKSARVNWIFSFGITILTANLLVAMFAPINNFFFKIAGMFTAYIVFFLMLMPFYFNPMIYFNNKTLAVFKKAFLLLMDNFGINFWLGLIMSLLLMVSAVSFFLLIFVYGAFSNYMVDKGFELIYSKYEQLEKGLQEEKS